jgi:hypothetical protein
MYWVAYQFEDPLSLVISVSKLVQIICGVRFNNYSLQFNCKKNRKKETFDVGNVFKKIDILLC